MVLGTDGAIRHLQPHGHWTTSTRRDRAFYHVAVSPQKPYWVYGGLQDNGTWGGPSMGLRGRGPITKTGWPSRRRRFRLPRRSERPELIYFESRTASWWRRHSRRASACRPAARQAKGAAPRYRFNWNTPFILSAHNSRIYYCRRQLRLSARWSAVDNLR